MRKFCGTLLLVFAVLGLNAQQVALPSDFRQQNITEYNSSLLNPAYSLKANNPSSIALWTRWQWQSYDTDPTSLFLNYTAKLNDVSAAGVGFFQHNTGIFLNTGVVLNFTYDIQLAEKIYLGVGANLFGYRQELADQRFFVPNPVQTSIANDFILQMAPGINLSIDKFNIGFTSENLFDYNFTANERNSSPDDRVFLALASYDIPISILNDPNSMLRPSVYYKSVPGFDSQFGLRSLLSTNKFWVQAGYNSFYGFSGGLGGRFFKRLSIGALVEVGTSSEFKGQDPTFEFVTSYKLGKLTSEVEPLIEELIAEEEKQAELVTEELTRAEERALKRQTKKQDRLAQKKAKMAQDDIKDTLESSAVAVKESKRDIRKRRDSIANAKAEQELASIKAIEQQRKTDSLATVLKAKEEALAEAQQLKLDSIAKSEAAIMEAERIKTELALRNEVVKPKAGEKYEEVSKEGSLEPGYYLIANVFGTKKYYELFMAEMTQKGLNPKSFYRARNKYNYVYLGRYNSIKEARAARDSKLDGKITGKLWILRVTGE